MQQRPQLAVLYPFLLILPPLGRQTISVSGFVEPSPEKHPVKNPSGLSTHISVPAPALRWPQPGLLPPVLRPPALTLLRCALSRKAKAKRCTMINSSHALLVFAMLSTASGWGLPSHDSLLSPNESTHAAGGVDGPRDRRQLGWGSSCDGGWSVVPAPRLTSVSPP